MKNKIIILLLLGFVSTQTYSQQQNIIKADKEYANYAFADAIKTYEHVFYKGYKSVDMLQKLANSYYFNADFDNAYKWYSELFALTEDLPTEYYYRYAQSLKSIKEYGKADDMMMQFGKKNLEDHRAILAASQKDYLSIIKRNSGRYVIKNAEINSKYSDYGSSFYGNKIIFASAKDNASFVNRKHSWTGESFTVLYMADKKVDGTLTAVENFSAKLNSRFHESTPVFTKDGKTIYFTRNNFLKGKKGKDANKTTLLKIYKATLENDKWINIVELPFNSDNYSVAHPALSDDEKCLYFASNMPGTLGESDIFKVSINIDGSYGIPQNLGNAINTEGRESFPFITAENELYFASDGQLGLGGLDIFVSKAEQDGNFKNVLNVGEPVNSSKDDFSFLISSDTRMGYVSSNREGGQGKDDIYDFIETSKIKYIREQFLAGVVINKKSGLQIAGAKVTLSDSNYKVIKELLTGNEGEFDFGKVERNSKYYIKTEESDYYTVENPVVIAEEAGEKMVKVELVEELKSGDDLAKILDLNIINFDLNKADIRPDAAYELAKICDVLLQNPSMRIDIRSHTDSRESKVYNQKLSESRAKSTMEWLIKNRIDRSRLTAKGYGETKLINICSDAVNCTEEEHQVNRRSEFIIVK